MKKNVKRIIAPIVLAAVVLTLPSCMTADSFGSLEDTGYQRVQVIDVRANEDYLDPDADIPLSAVLQPEDLRISPVIDIRTLKTVDGPTVNVTSSTLAQEERKDEITSAINAGQVVDTSLDESNYGDETSGALVENAANEAFEYVSNKNYFVQAIAEYDYVEGKIYELITSPRGITDFRLRPGEQIAGTPIVGNAADWQFSMGTSIEDGTTIQHIFIRPLKSGLDTSMVILTNERTYYFRLASFENQYMTGVRFRYPQPLSDGTFLIEDYADAMDSSIADYQFDISQADYDYGMRSRGNPEWKPVTVFSDDVKTYIQFPVTMSNSDQLPSAYIMRDGEEALVNFRYFGNLMQIDSVINEDQEIVLKTGQRQRVEIYRR